MNGDFRIELHGPDLEKGFTGDLLQPQEAGGGGVMYGFLVEDPKVKLLESTPDETLVERLCGKLTKHRFALGLAVWPDHNGPGHSYGVGHFPDADTAYDIHQVIDFAMGGKEPWSHNPLPECCREEESA